MDIARTKSENYPKQQTMLPKPQPPHWPPKPLPSLLQGPLSYTLMVDMHSTEQGHKQGRALFPKASI